MHASSCIIPRSIQLAFLCCTQWFLQRSDSALASSDSTSASLHQSQDPTRSCSLLQVGAKPSRILVATGLEAEEDENSKASDDTEKPDDATLHGIENETESPAQLPNVSSSQQTANESLYATAVAAASASIVPGTGGGFVLMQVTEGVRRAVQSAYNRGVVAIVLLCIGVPFLLGLIFFVVSRGRRRDDDREDAGARVSSGRSSAARLLNTQRQRAPGGSTASSQFPRLSQPLSPDIEADRVSPLPRTRRPLAAVPRALCPALVVPAGSDCVLVVRGFPDAVPETGKTLELDIFDIGGKPVLKASVEQPWPASGGKVVTLTSASQQLAASRPPEGKWLTLCRSGGGESDGRSVSIYDGNDVLFGCIKRDATKPRYVLTSTHGDLKLLFEGRFRENRVKILDRHHDMLAYSEPREMSFDPGGRFYQARIAARMDVGLVLSGLFAISAMEGV